MAIELDRVEQRVLGSLLEKERTVPDTFPMTLEGLTTACNQSSGRDPVLDLPEHEVLAALGRLRPRGLARVLHPSHGARQPKHRQVLDEVIEWYLRSHTGSAEAPTERAYVLGRRPTAT
jgi:hypothetical protein